MSRSNYKNLCEGYLDNTKPKIVYRERYAQPVSTPTTNDFRFFDAIKDEMKTVVTTESSNDKIPIFLDDIIKITLKKPLTKNTEEDYGEINPDLINSKFLAVPITKNISNKKLTNFSNKKTIKLCHIFRNYKFYDNHYYGTETDLIISSKCMDKKIFLSIHLLELLNPLHRNAYAMYMIMKFIFSYPINGNANEQLKLRKDGIHNLFTTLNNEGRKDFKDLISSNTPRKTDNIDILHDGSFNYTSKTTANIKEQIEMLLFEIGGEKEIIYTTNGTDLHFIFLEYYSAGTTSYIKFDSVLESPIGYELAITSSVYFQSCNLRSTERENEEIYQCQTSPSFVDYNRFTVGNKRSIDIGFIKLPAPTPTPTPTTTAMPTPAPVPCCYVSPTEIYENGKMVRKNIMKNPVPTNCANFVCEQSKNISRNVNLNSDCNYGTDVVNSSSCVNLKGGKMRSKTTTNSVRKLLNTQLIVCPKEKKTISTSESKNQCPR